MSSHGPGWRARTAFNRQEVSSVALLDVGTHGDVEGNAGQGCQGGNRPQSDHRLQVVQARLVQFRAPHCSCGPDLRPVHCSFSVRSRVALDANTAHMTREQFYSGSVELELRGRLVWKLHLVTRLDLDSLTVHDILAKVAIFHLRQGCQVECHGALG